MLLFEHVPHLDLHGENADIAKVLVHEFLRDCYLSHEERCVIVHGKGQGIVRNAVYQVLKGERYIDHYELDMYNDGQTLITLKRNI